MVAHQYTSRGLGRPNRDHHHQFGHGICRSNWNVYWWPYLGSNHPTISKRRRMALRRMLRLAEAEREQRRREHFQPTTFVCHSRASATSAKWHSGRRSVFSWTARKNWMLCNKLCAKNDGRVRVGLLLNSFRRSGARRRSIRSARVFAGSVSQVARVGLSDGSHPSR